jgi:Icc-related predicted phosphoesterase
MRCLFATDLHGHLTRYEALCERITAERPEVVLLGGDLLPNPLATGSDKLEEFFAEYLRDLLQRLRGQLGPAYPRVLAILGNDDGSAAEPDCLALESAGLWTYLQGRRLEVGGLDFYGYAYVPPTPFLLKDWERYDVSRYVDPGCVSPEEGARSVPVSDDEACYSTIAADLDRLAGEADLSRSIWLFHSPPYQTALDRAALDGKMVDHVPLDVHVGSIAIRRFLEERQPLVSLHGHVHESARLTGSWRDRLGRTHLFTAAHDGPELALVSFDTARPEAAERVLV